MVAKGIVLVDDVNEEYRITQRVAALDDEYKISATAVAAVKTTGAAISDLDQRLGISSTVSSTAASLDSEYQLSAKAAAASAAVLNNPLVQSGLSTVSSWGTSLASSFSLFSSETKERASELKAAKTPQPGQQ